MQFSGEKACGFGKLHAGGAEFRFDPGYGTVEVDGTAGVAHDDRRQAQAAGVESRVADAVVVGEPAEEDAREASLAEIAGEAGGGGAVVLKESGVGIDLRVEALAQDQLGLRQVKRGVELGAEGALNTVIGPERLGAVAQFDFVEGVFAGVSGGEGGMRGRVPVLREDDVLELWRNPVNHGNDRIAVCNGQCPSGAEVVLYVDHDENVLLGDLHGGFGERN